MAEPFKEIYNRKFVKELGQKIAEVQTSVDDKKFVQAICRRDWKELELKQRLRRIAEGMGEFVPSSFPKAVQILRPVAEQFSGLQGMVFPDFVEVFGGEFWDESWEALEDFTIDSSSEFAVRPFILQDLKRGMKRMLEWSEHPNYHVRRLATEGCRPRLPWAIALPPLKEDPSLILPVLEKLKNDESDYVRKSVANNLNDISKDNPELTLKIAKKWIGKSDQTDKLIKHGLRTLLKKSDPTALDLFGVGDTKGVTFSNFKLKKKTVKVGDELFWEYQINVKSKKYLRLEYVVHFLRKNGTHHKKVFKISERDFTKGEHSLAKKHSFRVITTRTYYPGTYYVNMRINGKDYDKERFMVRLHH